jgi:hypothetical protein
VKTFFAAVFRESTVVLYGRGEGIPVSVPLNMQERFTIAAAIADG